MAQNSLRAAKLAAQKAATIEATATEATANQGLVGRIASAAASTAQSFLSSINPVQASHDAIDQEWEEQHQQQRQQLQLQQYQQQYAQFQGHQTHSKQGIKRRQNGNMPPDRPKPLVSLPAQALASQPFSLLSQPLPPFPAKPSPISFQLNPRELSSSVVNLSPLGAITKVWAAAKMTADFVATTEQKMTKQTQEQERQKERDRDREGQLTVLPENQYLTLCNCL